MVSVITYHSDDPSSIPGVHSLQFKSKIVVEKNGNKQKEACVSPFFKK